jgi:hypothetical protein
MKQLSSLVGLCFLGLCASSCAKSPDTRFDDGSGETGGSLGITGSGGDTSTGSGGSLGIGVGGDSMAVDGGRATRVNDAGESVCINIGSYGKPGHYGFMPGVDNTSAFEAWLNSKSSAAASLIQTHQKLTADFLAGFDVIILQDLEDQQEGKGPFWTFTPDETQALATWVENGGGLIALTGYSGAFAQEIVPTNSLLKFSNISYTADDRLFTCGPPVMDCFCVGNSVPYTNFVPNDPIDANVTVLPVYHGHPIVAPDATTVAAVGNEKYAVRKTIGKGKVFVFGDEWVTYSSQWGQPLPQNVNPGTCQGVGPDKVYQVPQFWYNAIKWVAPPNTCFTIDDPAIVK